MTINMDRVLDDLGLSREWMDFFVQESNKLEPSPGTEPGSLLYQQHMDALSYALVMAHQDRYALPTEVHRLLLRGTPHAGELRAAHIRDRRVEIYLNPHRVPFFMWRWGMDTRQRIEAAREGDASDDERDSTVWNLHCELVNIHPYEQYNGRVGRIVMVNHALLTDLTPWIVTVEGRSEYLKLLKDHPSSGWAIKYDEEDDIHWSTVSDRARHNTDLPRHKLNQGPEGNGAVGGFGPTL